MRSLFVRLLRSSVSLRGSTRRAWLVTLLTAHIGGVLPAVLAPESGAGRGWVTAGLWLAWIVVSVMLIAPGARPMAVARIAVPANAVLQAWAFGAAVADSASSVGYAETVSLLAGLSAAVMVLLPGYGQAQVNAASYGDERRFLLRPPGPVLVALVVPSWLVAVTGAAAGPLLLAHGRWAAGALACVVGLPAAAFAAHALYRLGLRWLVFVPNGVVLHDHLAVAAPLPIRRRDISELRLAPALTTAADLTCQAFGMALELRLTEPATAAVVTGRDRSEETTLTAILFSPTRPADVISTAQHRGIKLTPA